MTASAPRSARGPRRFLLAALLSICGMTYAAPLAAAELVMFETEGCAWCAAWDREVGTVYARTVEGRLAPLRRVDKSAARPADLAAIEGIVYTPTFVLMDGGREVGRILGYPGESHFWGLLDVLLKKLPARAES